MPLCLLKGRVEIITSSRAMYKSYISRTFVSNVAKHV